MLRYTGTQYRELYLSGMHAVRVSRLSYECNSSRELCLTRKCWPCVCCIYLEAEAMEAARRAMSGP